MSPARLRDPVTRLLRSTPSALAVAISLAWAVTCVPASAAAQSIWMDRDRTRALWLEVLKPDFDRDVKDSTGVTFSSFAVLVSLRWRVSERVVLVGELPYARAGTDRIRIDGRTFNQDAIGNPYLGVEIGAPRSSVFAELGLRPPITPSGDNFAGFVGAFADFDRLEAFQSDRAFLSAVVNYRPNNASGIHPRLRAGPVFQMTTRGRGEFLEVWLVYSAQGWYDAGLVGLGAGLTGRALLTAEAFTFRRNTQHQVGVAARVTRGHLRPGLHARVPLDENLRDFLDFVVGLNLAMGL